MSIRTSLTRWMAPLALLLALGACAEDVEITPAPKGLVEAVFDPSAVPAQVPTPTDAIRNPFTSLLDVPDNAGASAAELEFNAFLRTLDGYPTGSTVTANFKGSIDKTSVVLAQKADDKPTIIVLDVTNAKTDPKSVKPVIGLKATLTETKDKDGKVTNTKLAISGPAGGWSRATTYAFFLLGGANGVKGGDKKEGVVRSALFELAAAKNPLCEWDATKFWYSATSKCSADKEMTSALTKCAADTDCDDSGKTGKCDTAAGSCTTGKLKETKVKGLPGCCLYNYSALLDSAVKKAVRADYAKNKPDADTAEIDKAVHAAVLAKATDFERLRSSYNGLLTILAATGAKREDVSLMWAFTTQSLSEIIYDPTTAEIPFPNDVLIDQKTGKVNIPEGKNETAGAKALRLGLNSLDGFTTTGGSYATFRGTVDPTTAKMLKGLVVLDTKAGSPVLGVKIEVDAKANALVLTPTTPFKENNQYAIVAFSKFKTERSVMANGGLTDKTGRRFGASSFIALSRSKATLLDKDGNSALPNVSDALAKQLEPARLAFKKLYDTLEASTLLPIKREEVVCAWAFTTQSITKPLTKLRALPWSALAAVEKAMGKAGPELTGTYDTTLTGFPTGKAKDAIAGWVQNGSFTSITVVDEAGTGAFHPDPAKCITDGKCKPGAISYTLTVPTGTAPATGWPVVLFQHGLDKARTDMLDMANVLAKGGFATIGFDVIYHGPRSWCTKDDHCKSGTCALTTGKCAAGFKDTDSDGIVDASGARFLNTANPFAVRDNMRQHVIDASSLLRALTMKGYLAIIDSNSAAGVVKLDEKKVHYVSQSLGSILGTLVLATTSAPKRAVLNVPGSPVVDIILTAPNYAATKAAVLKANGVTEGTPGYLQLVNTFKWILDPADPGNFAKHVISTPLSDDVLSAATKTAVKIPAKEVMIQLAGKDQTIPVKLGEALATWMGVSYGDTTYKDQGHGFLLSPDPKSSQTATDAARAQVVNFLTTGKVCKPDVTAGTCK